MAKQRERKQITKEVTVTLTDEELLECGRKAAGLRTERLKIEQEFQRVKATFKGKIEEKENELSKLLSVIGDGKETRTLNTVEEYDYENACVVTFLDDREIASRGMTAEERQLGFRFKTKEQEQTDALPSAADRPRAPGSDPATAEPWEVVLPPPEKVDQDVYVPGETDRPTKVRYLAETWRQEPGEAATYVVVEDDVFGTKTLLWRRKSANVIPLTPHPQEQPPVEEPAEQQPAPAAEQPAPEAAPAEVSNAETK